MPFGVLQSLSMNFKFALSLSNIYIHKTVYKVTISN